jgi:hypothetical protein
MHVAGSLTFTDTIAMEDGAMELEVDLPQPKINAAITANPATTDARTLAEQQNFVHLKFIGLPDVDIRDPSKQFFVAEELPGIDNCHMAGSKHRTPAVRCQKYSTRYPVRLSLQCV